MIERKRGEEKNGRETHRFQFRYIPSKIFCHSHHLINDAIHFLIIFGWKLLSLLIINETISYGGEKFGRKNTKDEEREYDKKN